MAWGSLLKGIGNIALGSAVNKGIDALGTPQERRPGIADDLDLSGDDYSDLAKEAMMPVNEMIQQAQLGAQTYADAAGVPSDIDWKSIKPCARTSLRILRNLEEDVSDEDFKTFEDVDPHEFAEAILKEGPPYSASEVQFLHEFMKENGADDYKYDIRNAEIWSPETLRGYAIHIKNSHYKYKPEAVDVDPRINPEEEHIGPMAQEIEQVNPACVKETPDGVKTVDSSRLALMNAGAIGDLARQALQHEDLIKKIAEKVGVYG